MNSNVMPSRVQMEPVLLQQLVAEVRETIAPGITTATTARKPSFRAINLWNIHRNGKFANGANQAIGRRQRGLVVTQMH